MSNESTPQVFPFGQPVRRCKPSANGARPFFILGAYPSALHVRWIPPLPYKPIRAIAIDNEPEPFWIGGQDEDRLIASWAQSVGWQDVWGTVKRASALNGSSGVWVEENVIRRICGKRDAAWITDCLDTYRCSKDLAARIDDTYNGFAESKGLKLANLRHHPHENEIVNEALSEQRERLKQELSVASPEVVITLGNAAFRVFKELVVLTGDVDPGAALSANSSDYGRRFKVRIGSQAAEWLPLAHPAAPPAYQIAHAAWLEKRPKLT